MAKVMISLPDDVLKGLDRVAKKQHKKRSELIRDLALQVIKGGEGSQRDSKQLLKRKNPFKDLREHRFSLEAGESVELMIRKMRDTRY
ncbi:MAG: ribbon-helix-helix protein, CopG family [Deltaproteobacteria bacterium]|nr:ribbon-helix-helix protein, CopG family [Deltaproteobacteria bacterium]